MGIHPVDALKDLGMTMTPESEARMRAICDEPVIACNHVDPLFGTCPGCGKVIGSVQAAPRLFTRVMDDGIETKDGAA